MKTLATIITLLILSLSLQASEIPNVNALKKTERAKMLFKVASALVHYDGDYGVYPPSLLTLVTKGYLKEKELTYKNADNSISIPDYFPGLSVGSKPGLPLLKAPSADGSYQIIIDTTLGTKGVEWTVGGKPDTPIKK